MSLAQNYEETWLGKFKYCDEIEAKNITDDTCQAFYVLFYSISYSLIYDFF